MNRFQQEEGKQSLSEITWKHEILEVIRYRNLTEGQWMDRNEWYFVTGENNSQMPLYYSMFTLCNYQKMCNELPY